MYALRRLSYPSFFHPSTNRRMYRLLNNGLIGEPCGLPRPSSRFRVLRRLFPRSSVSSTGASNHILIRWSMFLSTTRRATDFRSSECGRVWWVGTSLAVSPLVPVPPRRTRRADFPQRAPQAALVRLAVTPWHGVWTPHKVIRTRIDSVDRTRRVGVADSVVSTYGPIAAVPRAGLRRASACSDAR